MSTPERKRHARLNRFLVSVGLMIGTLISLQTAAAPDGPRLGKPLSPNDIAQMELTVFPDGRGLPDGSGTPEEGKVLYAAHCVACHGPEGQGGSGGELVGKSPLNGPHPDQTIGNYWPYATTLFDFIRRSMPLNAPRSLTDPNIYALTAYLLHLNGIISKDHAVNAKTLPEIKMPNREGFTRIWPHSN